MFTTYVYTRFKIKYPKRGGENAAVLLMRTDKDNDHKQKNLFSRVCDPFVHHFYIPTQSTIRQTITKKNQQIIFRPHKA